MDYYNKDYCVDELDDSSRNLTNNWLSISNMLLNNLNFLDIPNCHEKAGKISQEIRAVSKQSVKYWLSDRLPKRYHDIRLVVKAGHNLGNLDFAWFF